MGRGRGQALGAPTSPAPRHPPRQGVFMLREVPLCLQLSCACQSRRRGWPWVSEKKNKSDGVHPKVRQPETAWEARLGLEDSLANFARKTR